MVHQGVSVFQVNPHRGLQLRPLYLVIGQRIVVVPLVVEERHPAVQQGQEIHLVDPVADDGRFQRLLGLGDDAGLVKLGQFSLLSSWEIRSAMSG